MIQIGVAISYPLGRAAARMGENACCGAGIADGPSGAAWVPSSASSLEQLESTRGRLGRVWRCCSVWDVGMNED